MQQKFTVKNMKCDGCATAIKQALMNLAGVTEVIVDVAAGAVVVEGDPLATAELESQLESAGFPVVDAHNV